ncbi:hypothetical protein [Streptomyces sp. NPDC087300]|uniref:hypothetical protein n=1 Tax=Streptomyces sp. NPDC087300 TaxID=3365780 RepID=UPI00382F95E4
MKKLRAFGIATCSVAAAAVLALGGASAAHADPTWGTPPATETAATDYPGTEAMAVGPQEIASTSMDSNWG